MIKMMIKKINSLKYLFFTMMLLIIVATAVTAFSSACANGQCSPAICTVGTTSAIAEWDKQLAAALDRGAATLDINTAGGVKNPCGTAAQKTEGYKCVPKSIGSGFTTEYSFCSGSNYVTSKECPNNYVCCLPSNKKNPVPEGGMCSSTSWGDAVDAHCRKNCYGGAGANGDHGVIHSMKIPSNPWNTCTVGVCCRDELLYCGGGATAYTNNPLADNTKLYTAVRKKRYDSNRGLLDEIVNQCDVKYVSKNYVNLASSSTFCLGKSPKVTCAAKDSKSFAVSSCSKVSSSWCAEAWKLSSSSLFRKLTQPVTNPIGSSLDKQRYNLLCGSSGMRELLLNTCSKNTQTPPMPDSCWYRNKDCNTRRYGTYWCDKVDVLTACRDRISSISQHCSTGKIPMWMFGGSNLWKPKTEQGDCCELSGVTGSSTLPDCKVKYEKQICNHINYLLSKGQKNDLKNTLDTCEEIRFTCNTCTKYYPALTNSLCPGLKSRTGTCN